MTRLLHVGSRSGQLHGSMIVAMVAVRMMQPAVHEIIDMITMQATSADF